MAQQQSFLPRRIVICIRISKHELSSDFVAPGNSKRLAAIYKMSNEGIVVSLFKAGLEEVEVVISLGAVALGSVPEGSWRTDATVSTFDFDIYSTGDIIPGVDEQISGSGSTNSDFPVANSVWYEIVRVLDLELGKDGSALRASIARILLRTGGFSSARPRNQAGLSLGG
jgi:hypothetical protein